MKTSLLNFKAHDGSRNFSELPESCSWDELKKHIQRLPGARIKDYISDQVTEMWLDFSFSGHTFTVNNQMGDFWFFVQDSNCPDEILTVVVEHCETLLDGQSTSYPPK